MANNLIQIKRSNTSVTPANTLYGGELAYSYNSNSLFIGAQTGISAAAVKIGGAKYNYLDQATQGSLTANAVILVDANAFISNTYTAGLFIGSSIASPAANATAALITSISPQGNSIQLGGSAGGSNTELVTSYAIKTYVDGQIVTNGVNTAKAYTWSNVHTFNANVSLTGNATNVLIIGSTTINATTYSGTANNATNFGGLSLATVQGQITGNAATAYSNATAYADTKAGAAYSNAVAFANASISNGSWVAANATYAANSGALGGVTLTTLQSQITGNAATAYTNAVATAAADATSKAATAYSNAVATAAADATSKAATAYSNATAYADTKAATAYTNATVFASNASNINTGTLSAARLPANVVFWSNNNTFNGTQTFNDVTINGNTKIGNAATDAVTLVAGVNSTITPFANNTYDLGTPDRYWQNTYSNNIVAKTGDFAGNLNVGGNLVVAGNLVTTNVSSVLISDPIIYLASNNYASDLVDIGFAANYSPDGIAELHTGLVRKNGTDDYYLFVGSTEELANSVVINTNAVGFRNAVLHTFLESSGLTTNSTAVSLTANSTVSVSITANSVVLGTPLAATSGGTGQNTYTTGDMLYASGASALAKVAIGTFGTVLQANSSGLPQFATLDGGTF